MVKQNFNTTLYDKTYKNRERVPVLVSTEITPQDSTARYLQITQVACPQDFQSTQEHSLQRWITWLPIYISSSLQSLRLQLGLLSFTMDVNFIY